MENTPTPSEYATVEAARRMTQRSRWRILRGIALGRVRCMTLAGDRVLVHVGDVRQLAEQQSRSTHATTGTGPVAGRTNAEQG